MKNIKKLVAIALTTIVTLSFAGCSMVERTEESIPKMVLAKVGDKKITRADLDKTLQTYLDYYKQQYGDDYESNENVKSVLKTLRTQGLEMLVNQEVLLQSKDDFGVNPTDEELQEQVDNEVDYYKEVLGSDDAYENYLESYGYDDESFKEYLKEQAIVGMVFNAMVEGVEVTDEDVETYYNENIEQYTTKAGADVTHILVKPETDDEGEEVEGADDAAKAKAEAVREKALGGESLKDIANSDEFKDVCIYEDLGRVSFENSGMVQEFEDAFKQLEAGQVSDVVKTSFGYHVIVNTAIYPEAEVEPLDEELKSEIESKVLYDKQEETFNTELEKLKKKLKVKVYENRI